MTRATLSPKISLPRLVTLDWRGTVMTQREDIWKIWWLLVLHSLVKKYVTWQVKQHFLTSPILVITQVWEHLGVLKFQEWSRYVYTIKVRCPHKLSCFKKVRFVRNNVSILATYLSPNPTLTLTCYQLTLVGFSYEGQTLVTSAFKTITVVKRFRFFSLTLFEIKFDVNRFK